MADNAKDYFPLVLLYVLNPNNEGVVFDPKYHKITTTYYDDKEVEYKLIVRQRNNQVVATEISNAGIVKQRCH